MESSRTPSCRRLARLSAALGVALGLLVLPGKAHALEVFPGIIQKKYTLNCPPPCTLCHTSPSGGSETAVQPFVLNLLSFPVSVSEDTLPQLLDGLKNSPCPNTTDPGCKPDAMTGLCTGTCDANGDGTSDIDQLSHGVDPNTGEKLFCVTYGCCAGEHIEPEGRSFDGTAALAALGTLIVLASRWRRSVLSSRV
jgi:hypothetical protein